MFDFPANIEKSMLWGCNFEVESYKTIEKALDVCKKGLGKNQRWQSAIGRSEQGHKNHYKTLENTQNQLKIIEKPLVRERFQRKTFKTISQSKKL